MGNINQTLRERSKPFHTKLAKIKLALFDVDGVLTDGRLYWAGEEVGFNRFFHARDGYGLKILQEAGIRVGIITGGDSVGVEKRFKGLGIEFLYMGNEDKRSSFEKILAIVGCDKSEVLYMGDEFFDLPILKQVGFSATVPEASIEIQERVDYVTDVAAGMGAAREVIDMLRFARNFEPKIEY